MLIAGDKGKAVVGYIVAHALEATPGATIEIEGESFEVVSVMEMYPYPELPKAQPAIIALGEWISPDCAIFIPSAIMDDLFGGAGAPRFLAKAITLRSTAPDHPQVAAATVIDRMFQHVSVKIIEPDTKLPFQSLQNPSCSHVFPNLASPSKWNIR